MKVKVDARIAKRGIIKRLESIKPFSVLLGRTITAQKLSTEIDTYLWYHRSAVFMVRGRQVDACNKVFFAVGAQLANGQLTAC